MTELARDLYGFELEREVRDWLDSLSDSDYKRADEVCGLLAEKGTELGKHSGMLRRVMVGHGSVACVVSLCRPG